MTNITLDRPACHTHAPAHKTGTYTDSYGRTIDYLRISLTDRCNLRCVYCMPEEGVPALRHEDILSLEEIVELVQHAASRGIKHVRLTGGEPLVRKGITDLIRKIKAVEGIESVALTTNGTLLPRMAADLKAAGLDRVNLSLDSLDPEQYHAITRRGNLEDALNGINAAFEYGFDPVKLNVVVVRHLNQDLASFARLTLDKPLHVRFIEYMPIGNVTSDLPDAIGTQGKEANLPAGHIAWSEDDVISAQEIRDMLNQALVEKGYGPLIPLGSPDENADAPEGWGPATYYQIKGAQGTIGFISAISDHFCKKCNRLRLTSDGKLRPCLFNNTEIDIRTPLRAHDKQTVRGRFDEVLDRKAEGHLQQRGTNRNMNQVGG